MSEPRSGAKIVPTLLFHEPRRNSKEVTIPRIPSVTVETIGESCSPRSLPKLKVLMTLLATGPDIELSLVFTIHPILAPHLRTSHPESLHFL